MIIRKQIIRVVVAVSMIMIGMAGSGIGQMTGINQPAETATRADVNGGASADDFDRLEERARTFRSSALRTMTQTYTTGCLRLGL